ncbi:uncharacterized protein LOC108308091 [Cebus imitator]|uniref:uncharacterized protein LOC108308091 n=1 Tax=Cebus imitator TaxID=2715852 RepID=UPI00080A3F1C|nr:uncharacterized protein LOC108308091 [Cebus imitator]
MPLLAPVGPGFCSQLYHPCRTGSLAAPGRRGMQEDGDPNPGTLVSGRVGCPFLPWENSSPGNLYPGRRAVTSVLGYPLFSGGKEGAEARHGRRNGATVVPNPGGRERVGRARPGRRRGNPVSHMESWEKVAKKALWRPPFPERGCLGAVGTFPGRAPHRGGRLLLRSVRGRCSRAGQEETRGPSDLPSSRPRTPGPLLLRLPLAFVLGVPSRLEKSISPSPLLPIAISGFCEFRGAPPPPTATLPFSLRVLQETPSARSWCFGLAPPAWRSSRILPLFDFSPGTFQELQSRGLGGTKGLCEAPRGGGARPGAWSVEIPAGRGLGQENQVLAPGPACCAPPELGARGRGAGDPRGRSWRRPWVRVCPSCPFLRFPQVHRDVCVRTCVWVIWCSPGWWWRAPQAWESEPGSPWLAEPVLGFCEAGKGRRALPVWDLAPAWQGKVP